MCIKMCCHYSIKWRYAFSHLKTGVIRIHCEAMKEHGWILGNESVYEIYEYENLGVVKNYVGSFSSNVNENTGKTSKRQE